MEKTTLLVNCQVTYQKNTQLCHVDYWEFEAQERVRRAFKNGLTCFGAACICVFIPLVHFVLVPALLIATPIVVVKQLKMHKKIARITGACPQCKKQFLSGAQAYKTEFKIYCDQCRFPLEVRLVD